MQKIGDFFKRILSVQAREMLSRAQIAEAIRKHVKIDVVPENISFSGPFLLLKNVPSAARSELFIKKSAILRDINIILGSEKGAGRVLTDIR